MHAGARVLQHGACQPTGRAGCCRVLFARLGMRARRIERRASHIASRRVMSDAIAERLAVRARRIGRRARRSESRRVIECPGRHSVVATV
jgi:hypothetical protein